MAFLIHDSLLSTIIKHFENHPLPAVVSQPILTALQNTNFCKKIETVAKEAAPAVEAVAALIPAQDQAIVQTLTNVVEQVADNAPAAAQPVSGS